MSRSTYGLRTFARGWFAAAALFAVGIAAPPRAAADGCEDCPEPTKADLEAAGMKMPPDQFPCHSRYGIDGGECAVSITTPSTRKRSEWPVFAAQGEAWNCPEGKSDSTIKVTIAHSKNFEWKVSASLGAELSAVAIAKITALLSAGVGGGIGQAISGTIEQTISATLCHRLPWVAYFLVGDFVADFEITVKRRYAWWTNNTCTGWKTISKGNVWVVCDSGPGSASRWAPLGGFVSITDNACTAGCAGTVVYGWRGWFPPVRPPLGPFNPGDPGAAGSPPEEPRDPEGGDGASPEGSSGSQESPSDPPVDPPAVPPDAPSPVQPGASAPDDGGAWPSSSDPSGEPAWPLPPTYPDSSWPWLEPWPFPEGGLDSGSPEGDDPLGSTTPGSEAPVSAQPVGAEPEGGAGAPSAPPAPAGNQAPPAPTGNVA